MLENIIYNQTLLTGIAIGIYLLIYNNVVPKFRGRRRLASGIIGALLLQAALITFIPQLGIELPTVAEFKLVLFAAIVGAMIREAMDGLVK